ESGGRKREVRKPGESGRLRFAPTLADDLDGIAIRPFLPRLQGPDATIHGLVGKSDQAGYLIQPLVGPDDPFGDLPDVVTLTFHQDPGLPHLGFQPVQAAVHAVEATV